METRLEDAPCTPHGHIGAQPLAIFHELAASGTCMLWRCISECTLGAPRGAPSTPYPWRSGRGVTRITETCRCMEMRTRPCLRERRSAL